jgi:hypothetical protein
MQRFHAPTAYAPSHRFLSCVKRVIDGDVQRGVPSPHHDAGQPTEDNLYRAFLVDSATRPVGVPRSNSHPLDRPGELAQPHSQLASDVVAVSVGERDASHAHVRRNRRRATTYTLERPRYGWRQVCPPAGGYKVADFHVFTPVQFLALLSLERVTPVTSLNAAYCKFRTCFPTAFCRGKTVPATAALVTR